MRCQGFTSSGELSGLWNEPMEGPGAMKREQCVVWGEKEAQTREAHLGLRLMQGSQQRLGKREERPGQRAAGSGQSHRDSGSPFPDPRVPSSSLSTSLQ